MEKPQNPIKPQPKENIEEELVDQKLFIYDVKSDAVYCFNSGAALIWFLCDGTHTIDTIAREIANGFNLPEQQILTDVRDTVDQFQAFGLIETQ